ncbi:hypothetical protein MRX96_038034 [Rhipicephalus microplus]
MLGYAFHYDACYTYDIGVALGGEEREASTRATCDAPVAFQVTQEPQAYYSENGVCHAYAYVYYVSFYAMIPLIGTQWQRVIGLTLDSRGAPRLPVSCPRPQRVIAKKLEDFTSLLPKASSSLSPEPEPLLQTSSGSLNRRSAEVPVNEAFRRTHKYLKIGDRVSIGDSKLGILQYYGETHFAEGVLCGIELDDAAGGKHSGIVDGVVYFTCRPNHGIFVPESKVKLHVQQSVPTLPELPSPAQTENEQPAVRPKSASLLSRLPKLGFSGRASKSRHREIDTTEEVDDAGGYVTVCSTEVVSYSAERDAPLWKDATVYGSPDSDSDDYDRRDPSLRDHVSPEVLQELRSALMSELPPQQPAPEPSAAPKNALSPIHENSDEVESRCAKKILSQSPEGAVGGVDFLSPIAEIMDEIDEGSKQESLGLLTDGAMRDIAVSVDGQSYQGGSPKLVFCGRCG